MKFLDIQNNKEDEVTWEKIIQDPFDADLNPCPYQQNFKESMSCPKYQDINEEEGEEECDFVYITEAKCFCELSPKKEVSDE